MVLHWVAPRALSLEVLTELGDQGHRPCCQTSAGQPSWEAASVVTLAPLTGGNSAGLWKAPDAKPAADSPHSVTAIHQVSAQRRAAASVSGPAIQTDRPQLRMGDDLLIRIDSGGAVAEGLCAAGEGYAAGWGRQGRCGCGTWLLHDVATPALSPSSCRERRCQPWPGLSAADLPRQGHAPGAALPGQPPAAPAGAGWRHAPGPPW
jgi:hypothetical protein